MSTSLPVLGEGGYSSLIARPIDNTALATFMTCEKKFQYSMLEHRRSAGLPSPSLAYGTAWHKALETHYRLGGGAQDRARNRRAVEAAVALTGCAHDRIDDYRNADRVLLEYENYVDQFGMPAQEDAQTVGWPDQPMVEIATEITWPGALHPYAGKIDRVIKAQGLFFVEDHKTTSRWSDSYFNQFQLKNQMMGYAWEAWKLTGQPIAGVRINCHVIRKNDSLFKRQIVSFSQDRLKEWAENYNHWIKKIEHAIETKNFARNFDACDGKYGMCQYAGVCSTSPMIRQRVLEQDFDVVPWNPLEVEDGEDA